MISFTQGNLLNAKAEALVNTVNTVGIMGKGVALMFKETFPDNFKAYAVACKAQQVELGRMFVFERHQLMGPKWIINFPTKDHWRGSSQLEWIADGLEDLKRVIREHHIRSVALPPLGSGNGGLDWRVVRPLVMEALGSMPDVDVLIYEPTSQYQNVAKRTGVEKLTPARALVVEAVRRYMILGIDCTLLEVQKVAYFLQNIIEHLNLDNPFSLEFRADRFGPFAPKLTYLLNALDGSYLHCGKRLADAGPLDTIWFDSEKKDRVALYISTDGREYIAALDATSALIDGFESPLGMELLATVDWLLRYEGTGATVDAVRAGLRRWRGGANAGARKLRLFDDRLIELALARLTSEAPSGMARADG